MYWQEQARKQYFSKEKGFKPKVKIFCLEMASFVEQNGSICCAEWPNSIVLYAEAPAAGRFLLIFEKKIHLNHISRVFRAI